MQLPIIMGLRDALNEGKRELEMAASEWIVDQIEDEIKIAASHGLRRIKLYHQDSEGYITFSVPDNATFVEACRQICEDGFRLRVECSHNDCRSRDFVYSNLRHHNICHPESYWIKLEIYWD